MPPALNHTFNFDHSRYSCSGFFPCITKPLTTQDALTMKFLSFFPFSLWYALGGAFCIEVVGIFGIVSVVGVVGMSELFWQRCKFFMSDYIAFGLAYVLSEKDNRKGPERNIDVPFEKDIEKDAKRTAKRTSWTGLIILLATCSRASLVVSGIRCARRWL